jgi:hypothetical protein
MSELGGFELLPEFWLRRASRSATRAKSCSTAAFRASFSEISRRSFSLITQG